MHKLAINYETGVLSLVEIMGEFLLLAPGNVSEEEPIATFVIRMQPDLSVMTYQETNHPQIVLATS